MNYNSLNRVYPKNKVDLLTNVLNKLFNKTTINSGRPVFKNVSKDMKK